MKFIMKNGYTLAYRHRLLSLCHNPCIPRCRQPSSSLHTAKTYVHSGNMTHKQTNKLWQPAIKKYTFPQNSQKYLLCWLTSIFLICFLKLAPYRVPALLWKMCQTILYLNFSLMMKKYNKAGEQHARLIMKGVSNYSVS